MSGVATTKPELLSPAGDWDCARAAVENGADAIYFGLQTGLNARGRATNFALDDVPSLMTYLRTRGVCGYLTLNTLVFADELEQAEEVLRQVVAAGVDAVLVQDVGLLRLIRRLCPTLPVHASTQMTLSSVECLEAVESLGIQRVVLPRELSIEQIAAIHQRTPVELEIFVHGSLCISYSGQCLASLSMGGRSANRGQCAQPCRLPYEVRCDGRKLDAAMPYPLSPNDLAAYERLAALIAAGVRALKIEGRLKPSEYVASVTRQYRETLDQVASEFPSQRIAEMEAVFSRGFCRGWLDADGRRSVVSGESSDKRGILLGHVRGVRNGRILVELASSVRRGDGLMFESDPDHTVEQGGRVFEAFVDRRSIEEDVEEGQVELTFRHGSIDLGHIYLGQRVWKTDDPQAMRRIRQTYAGSRPQRRVPLDLTVEAAVGRPIHVAAVAQTGISCRLESDEPLAEAKKHPLTLETLAEQLGRLGNTPYELRRVDAKIDGRPMLPLSVFGKLRRELVERLETAASVVPSRPVERQSALAALRSEAINNGLISKVEPSMHVLCRTFEQIEAALECGASSIIADLQDRSRCREAVRVACGGGAKVLLATPRIHKPGESDVFTTLAQAEPDGILARNVAACSYFHSRGVPFVADFSLNAVNDLTVQWLHDRGAERVTAAYDLNGSRLLDLASRVPAEWLEVVVHRHTPMFHSEYCLFQGILSRASGQADCGRPCRGHGLRLRDRRNVEHVVLSDSQCRSTVFHGEAQRATDAMAGLRRLGVRDFRVELLKEKNLADVRRVLEMYRPTSGIV
jgi:putative protease